MEDFRVQRLEANKARIQAEMNHHRDNMPPDYQYLKHKEFFDMIKNYKVYLKVKTAADIVLQS